MKLKLFSAYGGYIRHGVSVNLWEFIWGGVNTRHYTLVHGLYFFRLFSWAIKIKGIVPSATIGYVPKSSRRGRYKRYRFRWDQDWRLEWACESIIHMKSRATLWSRLGLRPDCRYHSQNDCFGTV